MGAIDLSGLVAHLPDIVWTLDVSQPARYTFISPAVERVLGEPMQVFLDDTNHFFSRVHRRDLDQFDLSPPGPESDQAGRSRVRYFKPDGSMIWLDVHWSWVYGPAGDLSVMHGITRDVTEYAEIEARLRRSEIGMHHAQQMSNVGSFEWDAARSWSIWSPEHYRIFGYEPPDQVEDAQWIFQATVLPDDFLKVSRAWQRALERRETFQVEYRIRRPDGEMRWIESRGGARFDERGLVGVDGTVQDVTLAKRADEALHRFVADAAHELRTPVAAILGAVELLSQRRAALDDTQMEVLLDVLGRQSHRLRDIHTSLIDLLTFENDVGRIELAPVELVALANAAVREVSAPARKTVTIVGAPTVAMGEHARLSRMLVELLRNALDHGGDAIEVRVGDCDGLAEIAVVDDGPGLDDAQVAHVFMPFSRSDQPRRIGPGIGLAVVERLAAVLGATVAYEPIEGASSRFVVRLRAATEADADAAHTDGSAIASGRGLAAPVIPR